MNITTTRFPGAIITAIFLFKPYLALLRPLNYVVQLWSGLDTNMLASLRRSVTVIQGLPNLSYEETHMIKRTQAKDAWRRDRDS